MLIAGIWIHFKGFPVFSQLLGDSGTTVQWMEMCRCASFGNGNSPLALLSLLCGEWAACSCWPWEVKGAELSSRNLVRYIMLDLFLSWLWLELINSLGTFVQNRYPRIGLLLLFFFYTLDLWGTFKFKCPTSHSIRGKETWETILVSHIISTRVVW